MLGVLEEVPGAYAGQPVSSHVRVVFGRSGEGWQAYPSACPDAACLLNVAAAYPKETRWSVTFDGRLLGQLGARTPAAFERYSDIGLQDIAAGATVPSVGKPLAEYGGFSGMAVHRPLVAVTRPFAGDPEGWKPAHLSDEAISNLRRAFRQKYPTLCRADPKDETRRVPYRYAVRDIQLVKVYASRAHRVLAQLHVERAQDCAGADGGFGLDDPWFVAALGGPAEYLDSGIRLVDAGDYDGDGKSELVFAIDRYNRGGYELFYDGLRRRAVFEYSYH